MQGSISIQGEEHCIDITVSDFLFWLCYELSLGVEKPTDFYVSHFFACIRCPFKFQKKYMIDHNDFSHMNFNTKHIKSM